MSILRKSLDSVSIADLEALVEAQARESGELEFKGALPFVPQKGQAQTADRWIDKGDRVGEYARDEILSELIAFANADGGTLVLGLHETKNEPRRASHLEALPNCEGLARRLLDSTEDMIEPRLFAVNARAFPKDHQGNGYVVLRVGKSLHGPHRLRSTKEFYVRRGERAAKMDVREIKDTTLSLARTGDRVEASFEERGEALGKVFAALVTAPTKGGPGPLIVRVSAVPIGTLTIPDITTRQDLWWHGHGFNMTIGNEPYECGYPAREYVHRPEIRLRSLVTTPARDEGGCQRLLRSDGLVEFSLIHPRREPLMSGRNGNRFYVGWVMGLLVGTLAQTHHLRAATAGDAVEYGIEIEIFSEPKLDLSWNDRSLADRNQIQTGLPLRLPRYSVPLNSTYDDVIEAVLRDLFNACGRTFDEGAKVPWASLGVSA